MIIVRIWGGLGNQMFQYAYAKALQLRTGQKVYLDISEYTETTLRKYELDYFRVSLPIIKYGKNLFRYIDEKEAYRTISSDLKRMPFGFPVYWGREEFFQYKSCLLEVYGNWYLKGWFQSEKYFSEYRDIFIHEFKPINKVKIPTELREILKDENTVSVHFRRTDYNKHQGILEKDYYQRAIKIIDEKVLSPYFLIFSDDIEWVKNNIDFGERCYYVSDAAKYKNYEEQLLMSKCKNNIIANSTFSWWGAWLNENKNKMVIAPKKWFPLQKRKTDIVLDNWIQI